MQSGTSRCWPGIRIGQNIFDWLVAWVRVSVTMHGCSQHASSHVREQVRRRRRNALQCSLSLGVASLQAGGVAPLPIGFAQAPPAFEATSDAPEKTSRPPTQSQTPTTGTDVREQLIGGGIQLQQQTVLLAPPALHAELPDTRKLEILTELAGNFGWERFSRENLNAPTAIDMKPISDQHDQRLGYAIHSAYIVYADLKQLRDRDLMQSTFGPSAQSAQDDNTMRELTADELQSLGLKVPEDAPDRYLWMELELLRKVVIRGVAHVQLEEDDQGVELYWQLDPRFTWSAEPSAADDNLAKPPRATAALRNTWSPLATNDLGELVEGEPQPYSGLGGYLSVQTTGQAENQLLVESRMVLHEPQAWFGGSQYLRSKLLLSIREGTKSFRRKLR